MTSLRFVGDLPLWGGVLLALAVCVLSWRFYRRESLELPDRLRWLLPVLRSLAFFLGIMILTGPVLHHRTVTGEPGRVKIYVDASQSMGLLDRHLSDGRKLLIAEQQGWLEPGRINTSGLDQADKLAMTRATATAGVAQLDVSTDDVTEIRNRLVKDLQTMAVQDSVGSDGVNELVEQLQSEPASQDTITAVCASITDMEQGLRNTFNEDVQRLIDGDDDSIRTALAMFNETPRWRRAENALIDTEECLAAALKETHNVEILALHDQEAIELWNGFGDVDAPAEFSETPDAATSDLSSGITSTQTVSMARETTDDSTASGSGRANTAVVLLTDGQHNSGPSPLQTARVLGSQGVLFYPISMGGTQQPPDVAVKALEHPEMVFQKDRVRGTMIVEDRMPGGQPMIVEVSHDGDVLWTKQLLTENNGERRIEFEFSIDELVEKLGSQFDSGVTRHAVALAMMASINPLPGEAEDNNNTMPLRLSAITQNYRMLMVDGRPRWETRYLRNAFERDSQWDVDVIIAGPGNDIETLPRGEGDHMFPDNRDRLFEYDLVICGEVALELFSEHEFQWLREFVEVRGGGIIFIDGNRARLRAFTEQDLNPLLPVEWQSAEISSKPTYLQLTDKGSRVSALTFEVDTAANQRFWKELPPPHRISNVAPLPGAEVLVEAVVDGAPLPVVVTRNYGAGRVLYLASDETWRWRYQAADTYHQRIWNQLATYVMPRPFAASDEFLSVDTGPVSYNSGDSAAIRVRLRGLGGKPATDATVDALVWKNGRTVATVTLSADRDVPGIYRGNSGELSEGDYEVSVRASGFSQAALKARGQFVVMPPESGELTKTACNESLLQQMATESGGVYLREEQIGQLAGLLSPLSSGRIVETETLLWQSYWWFAAIMLLLAGEWFLRKRAGLL